MCSRLRVASHQAPTCLDTESPTQTSSTGAATSAGCTASKNWGSESGASVESACPAPLVRVQVAPTAPVPRFGPLPRSPDSVFLAGFPARPPRRSPDSASAQLASTEVFAIRALELPDQRVRPWRLPARPHPRHAVMLVRGSSGSPVRAFRGSRTSPPLRLLLRGASAAALLDLLSVSFSVRRLATSCGPTRRR